MAGAQGYYANIGLLWGPLILKEHAAALLALDLPFALLEPLFVHLSLSAAKPVPLPRGCPLGLFLGTV
eukprot:1157922-Pelagomonas_calceolata.AAC.8